MTHTVLPHPPAPTARKRGLPLAIVAGGGVLALALLMAVGGWGPGELRGSAIGKTARQFSGTAARGYAHQLTKVHLPGSYDVIKREQGGTYFAAGNGPYASTSYRTSESLPSAWAQVQRAMEQAGYTVRVAATNEAGPGAGVTRLEGTAPGRDLEALIAVGVVYDLPYGYVDVGPGTTGVLLVVEDHGRNR